MAGGGGSGSRAAAGGSRRAPIGPLKKGGAWGGREQGRSCTGLSYWSSQKKGGLGGEREQGEAALGSPIGGGR